MTNNVPHRLGLLSRALTTFCVIPSENKVRTYFILKNLFSKMQSSGCSCVPLDDRIIFYHDECGFQCIQWGGHKEHWGPLYLVLKSAADDSTFSALYNFILWQIDGFHRSSEQPCEWVKKCVQWQSREDCGQGVNFKKLSHFFPCKTGFLIPKPNQP